MEIVEAVAALRERRRALPDGVGVVLTMGALHAGHLALVAAARAENRAVVATIFVNPLQFGPHEDLARYPRPFERDAALLRDAGVGLLFHPSAEELYPAGFATTIEVGGPTERLEGAARPGHFRGVATVVTKLFNLTQPDRTYFGQKDAQQVAVIRRVIADLNLPIDLRVVPIVREPDGLALSSRNVYLDPAERAAAPTLYRALRAAHARWLAGERRADILRQTVCDTVAEEPLLALEYADVVDPDSFAALNDAPPGALIVLAARCGPVRLIDNLLLEAAR
ncbi:MAG: pantoate--beta-alanine ligase [Thermomicrobiales bacterium]